MFLSVLNLFQAVQSGLHSSNIILILFPLQAGFPHQLSLLSSHSVARIVKLEAEIRIRCGAALVQSLFLLRFVCRNRNGKLIRTLVCSRVQPALTDPLFLLPSVLQSLSFEALIRRPLCDGWQVHSYN